MYISNHVSKINKTRNIPRAEAIRLARELRREREESAFWFRFSFVMVCLAAASTGAMLAVAMTAGIL